MRWALVWSLLAAAILLGGGRGPAPWPVKSQRAKARRAKSSPRLSPRGVRMVGAGCVALGCVALLGAGAGGVTALVLGPLAAGLLGRVAHRPARAGPDPALALALDLAAVALRSGRTVASALDLAAPTLTEPVAGEWRRVAGLLALGAAPEQAWASMSEDPMLAPVAVTARRSAHSGARLAHAFSQLAVQTRASLQAAALARANRAGVLAMAPLGLCFLPAFVCLGIVPTIAGIAGEALGSLP